MSDLINLDGGSYTATEIFTAIAKSNDPSVDLTQVSNKLDAIASRLDAIESQLANFPSSWTIV